MHKNFFCTSFRTGKEIIYTAKSPNYWTKNAGEWEPSSRIGLVYDKEKQNQNAGSVSFLLCKSISVENKIIKLGR